MTTTHDYIRDGAAIYARSFAIIRAEAELSRFSALEERVAVREAPLPDASLILYGDDIEYSWGIKKLGYEWPHFTLAVSLEKAR